jgi:hypothetical protein
MEYIQTGLATLNSDLVALRWFMFLGFGTIWAVITGTMLYTTWTIAAEQFSSGIDGLIRGIIANIFITPVMLFLTVVVSGFFLFPMMLPLGA